MNIYLDNSATTRISKDTKDYLISILDTFGNPSSLYSYGTDAKKVIEQSRKSVAKFVNASSDCIFFTPSGSASNTLGVRGYYQKNDCSVLYSPIAHKSILKCVGKYKRSHPLRVDASGRIDTKDLEKKLAATAAQALVVIDYANSELGTIQEVEKIISLVHAFKGIVYLDCTGSIPTIPVDAHKSDADMMGFSAHKLNGLKGCGVLYKKKTLELEPLIYGTQEMGLIGGTENILGIASLGRAVEHYDYSSVSSHARDYIYKNIHSRIRGSYIIGPSIISKNRLPHNLYVCFKGIDGESLMILLDMNGIQVSTGSACSSKSLEPSAALAEIGMNEDDIHSCIRMTFSGKETKEELDYICITLEKCVETLRNTNYTH